MAHGEAASLRSVDANEHAHPWSIHTATYVPSWFSSGEAHRYRQHRPRQVVTESCSCDDLMVIRARHPRVGRFVHPKYPAARLVESPPRSCLEQGTLDLAKTPPFCARAMEGVRLALVSNEGLTSGFPSTGYHSLVGTEQETRRKPVKLISGKEEADSRRPPALRRN